VNVNVRRAGILTLIFGILMQNASATELQGHRGARGVLPENSLPSFEHAIAVGANCLELDIAMSRDKQLVITHDLRLNPDIVRQGKDWITQSVLVKDLTVAQLKTYDIGRLKSGSRYAARFPQQKSIDGLKIPLLSELLNHPQIQSSKTVCLDIEIKTTPAEQDATFAPALIADALVQLVVKSGLRSRIRVRSFDWRSLLHLTRIAPDIPLAFLTAKQHWLNNLEVGAAGKSPWLAGIDIDDFGGSAPKVIKYLNGNVWAPYHRDLTAEELKSAQDLGLRVIVWTVNDEIEMRRLLEMGVDGITTDYPEVARRVIDEWSTVKQ